MTISITSNISYTLYDVRIHDGGAVSVTLEITAAGIGSQLVTHEITALEAQPYWTAFADVTKSRWDDLTGILYQILIDKGHIATVI